MKWTKIACIKQQQQRAIHSSIDVEEQCQQHDMTFLLRRHCILRTECWLLNDINARDMYSFCQKEVTIWWAQSERLASVDGSFELKMYHSFVRLDTAVSAVKLATAEMISFIAIYLFTPTNPANGFARAQDDGFDLIWWLIRKSFGAQNKTEKPFFSVFLLHKFRVRAWIFKWITDRKKEIVYINANALNGALYGVPTVGTPTNKRFSVQRTELPLEKKTRWISVSVANATC